MIQEISLTHKGVVLCAAKSFSLEEPDVISCAIGWCRTRLSRREADDFGAQLETLAVFSALAMITRRVHAPSGYSLSVRGSRPSTILPRYGPSGHCFRCSCRRYGQGAMGLKVDYSMTPAEVFQAATRALISDNEGKSRARYSLDRCVPREEVENPNISSLPSWVPDWRQIGKHGWPVPTVHGQLDIDATAAMPIPLAMKNRFQTPRVLHCCRYRVDVIEEVTQLPAPNKANSHPHVWRSSILKFAHSGTSCGPGGDYIWRTAIRARFEERFPEAGNDPEQYLAWRRH